MMKQYKEIKSNYEDAILLFRLGDFYEAFFEDARVISEELQIVLTSRNGTPMAGIPYHALDNYLKKLIKRGYKVAICDQVEDPKQAKGIVRREVTRVVTPGMVIEDTILEEQNNYILAMIKKDEGVLTAQLDLSTGDFLVFELDDMNSFIEHVQKVSASQLLLPKEYQEEFNDYMKMIQDIFIEYLDDWYYDKKNSLEKIKDFYSIAIVDSLGVEDKYIPLIGAVLEYIELMQRTTVKSLKKPVKISNKDYMSIDLPTIENIDLIPIKGKEKSKTLFGILDKCITSMGSRLLKNWIVTPLLDLNKIEERLDFVEAFYNDRILLNEIREYLKNVYDLERIVTRVSLNRATVRDVVSLRETLKMIPYIRSALFTNKFLSKLAETIVDLNELFEFLEKSINDDPSSQLGTGNVIKRGFSEKLDEHVDLLIHGEEKIKEMEKNERLKTGINNLKIGYNKVFGYYIEISKSNLSKVPSDYVRKQTLVNSERFITDELKAFENKILHAKEIVEQLEKELFSKVCSEIQRYLRDIQVNAHILSKIDVISSLALCALENNYIRPSFADSMTLKSSRHPIVEKFERNFIKNDLKMDSRQKFMVLTGPNMSGKSTFIRQVALIAVMAQIGSFVPADEAILPVFDRVFTRIGAKDDIASGKSTFLVEMSETALILRYATEKSLVILDEVGRGTSTFDGISIAWAVSEYLYKVLNPYVIFATHYTELTELANLYTGIFNKTFLVKRTDNGIVFLHKLVDGVSERSYGIEVAKVAGIDDEIIERAKEILNIITKESQIDKRVKNIGDRELEELKRKTRRRRKIFKNEQLKLF
ncbi:MAG TPA: DNA mismatch repair protein MutS [Thermotogaceae bacterium]|nr:DNA mismatch repair protein MutS [Thermotogaceae bacterium]